MTELLFHADPYAKSASASVTAVHDDGAIELDRTIFFAMGGGQPGDTGTLSFDGGTVRITDTHKGATLDNILHRPAAESNLPKVGDAVVLHLDWDRRYRHMRMHTLLHLLCASVAGDVTGGSISIDKSRLDFNLPDGPPDKAALEQRLNSLVAEAHPVAQSYISEAALAKAPGLVRTMAVAPPSHQGNIRLVTIGDPTAPIDQQPCGGTHLANTKEIGTVIVGKIENKGRQNRRINLKLAD